MFSKGKTAQVSIHLDGKEVAVPAGMNLVDAVALHGKEIPHYCYHPQLSVAGNCRMCLIEMGTPMRDRGTGEPILEEDGSPKIGWVPKPVIGCGTTFLRVCRQDRVRDGDRLREGIMEFLLVNHPWTVRFAIKPVNADCRNSPRTMAVGTAVTRSAKTLNPSAPDSGRASPLMMNVVFFVPDAFAFARKWRMTMFWVLSIEAAFPL